MIVIFCTASIGKLESILGECDIVPSDAWLQIRKRDSIGRTTVTFYHIDKTQSAYDRGSPMKSLATPLAAAIILAAMPARAAETITYSYDVKGRLVKVVHTGTAGNNAQTTYNHDKSDNRTHVKTTGAP